MNNMTNEYERQEEAPQRLFGAARLNAPPFPPRGDTESLGGLDALSNQPETAPVILIDGRESSLKTLLAVLANSAVVTTPTGIDFIRDRRNLADVDWSPLFGRRVYIWQMPSIEGEELSERIASHLAGKSAEITVVYWPDRWREELTFSSGLYDAFFDEFYVHGVHTDNRSAWHEIARSAFAGVVAASREEAAF
jgi:hypothetical protein